MELKYVHNLRVRYGETDKMGVVYHANYLLYFEEARVEMLRSLGIVYSELEKSGVMLPVVNVNLNYKKSAYYDDEIFIHTYIKKTPTARFVFHYEIFNVNNELLITGETTLVFIDEKLRKPILPPKEVLEKLAIKGLK